MTQHLLELVRLRDVVGWVGWRGEATKRLRRVVVCGARHKPTCLIWILILTEFTVTAAGWNVGGSEPGTRCGKQQLRACMVGVVYAPEGSIKHFSLSVRQILIGFSNNSLLPLTSTSGLLCLSTICDGKFRKHKPAFSVLRTHAR